MTKEDLKLPQQNLLFTKEADLLIRQGYKLGTTKIPRADSEVFRGEVVKADFGPELAGYGLRIIDVSDQPLQDLSVARLALGGFMSVTEAEERLSNFFDTQINGQTVVRHIVFLPDNRFVALPQEQQDFLLHLPTEQAMRRKELRRIYFPSLVHWVLKKIPGGDENWPNFLQEQHVITEQDFAALSGMSSLPKEENEIINVLLG